MELSELYAEGNQEAAMAWVLTGSLAHYSLPPATVHTTAPVAGPVIFSVTSWMQ